MSQTEIQKTIEEQRIKIDSKSISALSEKFDCSLQTVRLSLKFLLNSEKAVQIRLAAKEILLQQVNKIK